MAPADWFLTAPEWGNPSAGIPSWTEGNLAEPLVHGATYFDRLVHEVEALQAGDYLLFTDWRGDPDERMRAEGPTVSELFSAAARRGVVVKGLMWRSHSDRLQLSQEENRDLAEQVEAAGGEVLLDQRVRRGGSHHQKLVVLRHPGRPERDLAFAGGIDLCHGRRDDAYHRGDPQPVVMSRRYGDRPAWHDVQLQLRGPVVGVLDRVFRQRWKNPLPPGYEAPVAWIRERLARADLTADELPPAPPDPAPCGPHAVQVLRTYPAMRPRYDFAPSGERSVARGYTKAIRRAERLIYLEDQYLWSAEVASLFAEALRSNQRLHLIAVVPRYPEIDRPFALPPNLIGREQAMATCLNAGGDRVHIFDLENHAGAAIYVHAKVCVVDDEWATVGSDNFNRRSWTHDSELSCAVLDQTRDPRAPQDPAGRGDGARVFARELRLRLLREHLDLPPDGSQDAGLIDPDAAVAATRASAERLRDWHRAGRNGPRPPGRLLPHDPERVGWHTRWWALPAYRMLYDPDGRPWLDRRRGRW